MNAIKGVFQQNVTDFYRSADVCLDLLQTGPALPKLSKNYYMILYCLIVRHGVDRVV